MNPQDVDAYGGLKSDEKPQTSPLTQDRSDSHNVRKADLAALTQVPWRAWVNWTSVASNGFIDPANVSHRSLWGSGSGQKPTVQRTATGLYTVSYTASFLLGYTDNPSTDTTEAVNFVEALVVCSSSTVADDFSDSRRLTISGSVVTLVTKAGGSAADVGNSSAAAFNVSLFLF